MDQKSLAGIDNIANTNTLWVILSVVTFLFLVISMIFLYHWHKFGMRATAIATAQIVYFIGAGVLILGAIFSILMF